MWSDRVSAYRKRSAVHNVVRLTMSYELTKNNRMLARLHVITIIPDSPHSLRQEDGLLYPVMPMQNRKPEHQRYLCVLVFVT